MARLVFTDKIFAGKCYDFTLEKTTVGRGDKNDLVIRDPSVSLHHCEILVHGCEVIVVELGSSNGTCVNGVRLKGQSQLKSGQVVRFGNVEARLELDPPTETGDATAITAIQALRHYERKQEREQEKRHPSHVLLKPASGGDEPPAERTILLPKASSPQPAQTPILGGQTDVSRRRSSRSKMIVIALVAAVAVIILVWVMRGRL
jgi:pSer/pThr/pTyr-binding forkhead associated (FHA) protein